MSKITEKMRQALTRYEETGSLEGVHHHTVAALKRHGLLEERSAPVAETIGQEKPYDYHWYDRGLFRLSPTLDARRGDYAFWDKARKGKARGLELAGAFLKPLESKLSAWVLGAMPKFKSDNEDLVGFVAEWWGDAMAEIQRAYREGVGLGDCYIVFNGDGTITVVAPHVVDPIVSEEDFSEVIGYRIIQRYSHPSDVGRYQTIEDRYFADRRERIVITSVGRGQTRSTERFDNPLGMIPVVKIKNNATVGELHGRPEGEALLHIFEAYNDVILAGIQGNIRQGRPTPTMEGVPPDQIADLLEKFGENETYTDSEGNKKTRKVLRFSSDNMMFTPGTFKYAQPGAFIGDTEMLLGLLFYLILQHTEIPEFIWGNAIASSKASAESQMPPFAKFIEGKQTGIGYWVQHLLKLVVAWYATFEPQVDAEDEVRVTYAPLTDADGKLTLDAIALGLRERLLDRETALRLMPLDVDDPLAVLEKIEEEIEAEREELEAQRVAQVERDTGFSDEDGEEDDEEEPSVGEALATLEESDGNTGAMAAFFLPEEQANLLYGLSTMSGLETTLPTDMHLTLSYMGEAADLSQAMAVQAMRAFTEVQMPINGQISGIGRFTDTHIEGYDAIYASFDSPDLPMFRQNLVRTLMEHGINTDMSHGFTPHITLSYVPSHVDTPPLRVPVIPVRFEAVTLAWGGDRTVYPLLAADEAREAPDAA